MATTKYSHQRQMILDFLKSRHDHPTAEVIYQNLRAECPSLSLGTVYRNLAKLSNAGTIIKISCDDSSDHFDGNPTPHGHFICNSCRQILDFQMNTLNIPNIIEENQFDGEITYCQLVFYGTCTDCKKNEPIKTP